MEASQIILIFKIKPIKRKITAIFSNEDKIIEFLMELRKENIVKFGDIVFQSKDFQYAIIKRK